jgi:YD repeat-containing protein
VYDRSGRVMDVGLSYGVKVGSGYVVTGTQYYLYDYDERGMLCWKDLIGSDQTLSITPVYDSLGRMTERTENYCNLWKSSINAGYVSQNSFTSGRVSTYSVSLISLLYYTTLSNVTYKYTYDADGNITEIKDANNVTQYKYTYDSLGQLTREDNRPLNQSYTYAYDKNGNIILKKTYAFTTGTLGSETNVATYSYTDSSWKDLLTNYNGSSITYDGIGNPTAIGGVYLSWPVRRQR